MAYISSQQRLDNNTHRQSQPIIAQMKYKQFHSFWLWKRDIITRNIYHTKNHHDGIYIIATANLLQQKSNNNDKQSHKQQANSNNNDKQSHKQSLNTFWHITTQYLSHNSQITLTSSWISMLAWNSLTSMRAASIWPFSQASIRAVRPSYQHTISTHQTTIHTQYTPMLHTIIELLLHRPRPT